MYNSFTSKVSFHFGDIIPMVFKNRCGKYEEQSAKIIGKHRADNGVYEYKVRVAPQILHEHDEGNV